MKFKIIAFFVMVIPYSFAANGMTRTVILLNGTGSAGKSSIGRELEQTMDNAVFVSEELLQHNVFSTILTKHGFSSQADFKQDIEFIEKILSGGHETAKALERDLEKVDAKMDKTYCWHTSISRDGVLFSRQTFRTH